ncbi:MAG: hypothetical protein OQK78_05475 [Gammaproteobacteria bacterium]|nr:hypothetical protein [Gammaproteobacteria bacterium]
MKGQIKALPILLSCLVSSPLWAEESLDQLLEGFDAEPVSAQPAESGNGELDDLMGGFDEPSSESSGERSSSSQPKNWELSGALSLQGEYGYAHDAPLSGADYRGLSHLRTSLNLGLDYRFSPTWRGYLSGHINYDAGYLLNGRSHYSSTLLDAEESELEIDEARLQGQLSSNVDLTIGRQIVVWGKSDNLTVTNLLNPIDNRAPGMVDIKDLRLPLTMAKLDYYVGDWGFSAIVIPEIRFNKIPTQGSEFYPYPMAQPAEIVPDDGGSNSELAFAANGRFSGWDLSLYHAQLYDDNPYQTMVGMTPVLKHSRIKMSGVAANWVTGSWLLKGEVALLDDLHYSGVSPSYNRADLLVGAEYNGIISTSLSAELVERTIRDHDAVLSGVGVAKVSRQLALSAKRDFNHDRFHLMGLVLLNDWKLGSGGIVRVSGEYELNDALALTVGVVDYLSADSLPYSAVADNDRLFVRAEYSF